MDRGSGKGFTMVEILIVMSIIAILATVLFVSLGNQRQRARVAGAVAAVKSAMPITLTCVSIDGTVQPPDVSGGNPICSGSPESPADSVWPVLSNNCHYCNPWDGQIVRFSCSACASGDSICDTKSGLCEQKN